MFTPAPKVRAVYQLCRASEQIGTKTNDGPFIAEACSVADQRKRPIVSPWFRFAPEHGVISVDILIRAQTFGSIRSPRDPRTRDALKIDSTAD